RNEPKPIQLQTGDTLYLGGEGYVMGDSIEVTIGNRATSAAVSIDSSNRLAGWAVLPDIPEGDYAVSITGRASGSTTSIETIHITRSLKFECENLWDRASSFDGTSRYRNLIDQLSYNWSQDAVLDFRPDPKAREVQLPFYVSTSDTFAAATYLTPGTGFGNYDVSVDGAVLAHFNGYAAGEYDPPDSLGLGVLYLDRGEHNLSFRYVGKDPLATDSELWADYLTLDPTTTLHALDSPKQNGAPPSSIQLFPDPTSDFISVTVPAPNTNTLDASIMNVIGTVLREENGLQNVEGVYRLSVAGLPSGTYWVRIRNGSINLTMPFHILH
ncbi:MAG: T9SS type A sorting domain-containing protein, partial [Candidatus Kapaibacterium sp.]